MNSLFQVTKKCTPPCASTDAIFYAGTGSLLCRSDDKVVLFDVQQRHAVAELATPYVKYVVWTHDMDKVALLSKHAIIVASRRLAHSCTVRVWRAAERRSERHGEGRCEGDTVGNTVRETQSETR